MKPTNPTKLVSSAIAIAVPVVALCNLATAQPASAPAPAPAPAAAPAPTVEADVGHRHDGLFLRAHVGIGQTRFVDDRGLIEVKGLGYGVGVAVGYAVTPNLVLYGEVMADVAYGPDLSAGGVTVEAADISAGVYGAGVGAAYYLMPLNAYLSTTVAMSRLSIIDNDSQRTMGHTGFGPGVSIMAGKEWWIGKSKGLGIAGQFFIGTQPEQDIDLSYRTTAFALVMTGSYN